MKRVAMMNLFDGHHICICKDVEAKGKVDKAKDPAHDVVGDVKDAFWDVNRASECHLGHPARCARSRPSGTPGGAHHLP
jgi:hypothetical protein